MFILIWIFVFQNNRQLIQFINYTNSKMNENQPMRNNKSQEEIQEEHNVGDTFIHVYEAEFVNKQKREEKLREFYTPLEFPCCGDYLEPNLQTIADKKRKLNKDFVSEREVQEAQKYMPFDGVFQHNQAEKQLDPDLIRLKTRIIRDGREEYFQKNRGFVIQKQLFQDQLSRLANISYEQNHSIKTFQKNAILSQRNNQKKSTPFELEINVGCIWFLRHALMNDEERKFEELTASLREYSILSTYPTLSELHREKQHLNEVKEQMVRVEAPHEQLEQVVSKIQYVNRVYEREIDKIQGVMRRTLQIWKQLKIIRRDTGMDTVPYSFNAKQYEVEGRKSYDFGVTPIDVIEKPIGNGAQQEIKRRADIREERYFIRIYINGYEVVKSQKVNLQWPSYKVPFNQKFSVIVYSAPSNIQVQVIKSGLINQTVDVINLAIPGINAKTITSAEQRLATASFASNGEKWRKKQEQPVAPYGSIIYRIQWKGQSGKMPPIGYKTFEEETMANTEDTVQEIDLRQLSDPKDPRIQERVRREIVQNQIVQGSGGALLPFIDIQSTRHLLLKMKANNPQFKTIQIPLLEEQIRKRQDLLIKIDKEKMKSIQTFDIDQQNIYNPLEGIFKLQDENILNQIREIILKIHSIKVNSLGTSSNSIKYKITEEVINEYIFEQMESPIVVFCRNLFTQKRKLGPTVTVYQQPRNNIDDLEINLHARSAKNVPIRESSFSKIRHFQEEQARMHQMHMNQQMNQMNPQMNFNNNNMGMYGMSLHQRQQNVNMQGQNFFVPGMQNFGQNRQMQANIEKRSLQRNNTFVELRFKKNLKRTQCFEGPYPEWNQTLDFKYSFKNESMTLDKMFTNNQKSLDVILFDMNEESKPTTALAEARIKKTKFYLGRIQIPFSMLVAMPSVSGLFKIDRPLILFGYGVKKAGLFDFQSDPEEANKTENPDIHTFLNLDLFTQPLVDNLTAYNSDRKYTSNSEKAFILQRASDWLQDLNTKRYIRLWLNNIEGKSIFICQYLSNSICPPPSLGNQNAIQRCARFVSLIPKKFNCKIMENTQEFHLTCDQFLNIKMGEDHGILLCNYFNFIDRREGRQHIESYLAIGKAFPYGKSIFVLRRDKQNNNCQLWDPYEGYCCFLPAKQYETFCCFFTSAKKRQSQSQKDTCQMFELGCIVSETNVYINTQESLLSTDLDFNLEDEKKWKPFLTQRMRTQFFDRGQIISIQPEITPDFYPEIKNLEPQLENRLFEYLRKNLESERRKHFKPYTFKLNSNFSNTIRNKLLVECELFKNDFRTSGNDSRLYSDLSREQKAKYPKALQDLEQQKNRIKGEVDADKNMYGYTLNMAFTTYHDIWQRIQETQIHLDETQNMEFVLSVRCFEHATHIISVWVFVGSIA